MRFIIVLSLIAVAFSGETRIKVGSKRWVFNIETNEGKNVREEYTDESGVTRGSFSFVGDEDQPKQLRYKFDTNGEEPDISFTVVSENAEQINNETTESNTKDATNDSRSITEDNYKSIDGKDEFSGHVSFRVGKSVYIINFLTGDKTHAREEAYDESGMIYGKYTVFNEDKQSKVIVNYKFNSTGSDPTFEVSMYKKSERPKPEEQPQNQNIYYDPNRVSRRILMPSRQYSNSMPSVTLQSTNPPHNIVTPMHGNWYYRVQ